jgi:hypothetical protein
MSAEFIEWANQKEDFSTKLFNAQKTAYTTVDLNENRKSGIKLSTDVMIWTKNVHAAEKVKIVGETMEEFIMADCEKLKEDFKSLDKETDAVNPADGKKLESLLEKIHKVLRVSFIITPPPQQQAIQAEAPKKGVDYDKRPLKLDEILESFFPKGHLVVQKSDSPIYLHYIDMVERIENMKKGNGTTKSSTSVSLSLEGDAKKLINCIQNDFMFMYIIRNTVVYTSKKEGEELWASPGNNCFGRIDKFLKTALLAVTLKSCSNSPIGEIKVSLEQTIWLFMGEASEELKNITPLYISKVKESTNSFTYHVLINIGFHEEPVAQVGEKRKAESYVTENSNDSQEVDVPPPQDQLEASTAKYNSQKKDGDKYDWAPHRVCYDCGELKHKDGEKCRFGKFFLARNYVVRMRTGGKGWKIYRKRNQKM